MSGADGRDGSVTLNADASIYAGCFDGEESAELSLDVARLGYVHVARGTVMVNGQVAEAGDAVLLEREPTLRLTQGRDAEVLVFDLAP